MTEFGIEAEFAANANMVIAGLHERGVAGAASLHGYHCDCDYCGFRNGYAFRGQTDSSCSGEIISDVFDTCESYDGTPVNELFGMLADVAVEVDAEPGLNSGLHVHVNIEGRTSEQLYDALWQFVRWEPVLQRIAGGRWSDQRERVNTNVRDSQAGYFYNYARHQLGLDMARPTSRNLAQFEQRLHDSDTCDWYGFLSGLWASHSRADRHSNLNIAARRQPTWEFRLWNSTRVAWRMEMFAGLSVALLDPTVIQYLSQQEIPLRRNRASAGIDSVAAAVSLADNETLAELLMRQAAYLDTRADHAPSLLTAL